VAAWEEAIAHWEAALELWGEGEAREHAVLLERVGEAHYLSGIDFDAGVAALEQALAIQTELGDEQRQARLHSRIGRALGGLPLSRVDLPRSFAHFERAIEILERGDHEVALAAAIMGMASAQYIGGRWKESLATSERALEIAERLDNEALRAASNMIWACTAFPLGRLREALERSGIALEIAVRQNYGFVASMSASLVGSSVWLLDPGSTQGIVERVLDDLKASQSPMQRGLVTSVYATGLGLSGRLDELRKLVQDFQGTGLAEQRAFAFIDWSLAERTLRERLEALRAGGASGMLATHLGDLGWVCELQGDEEGARAIYAEAIALCQQAGDRTHLLLARLRLAVLEADADEREQPRVHPRDLAAVDRDRGRAHALRHGAHRGT
jgi:tetratricopeptide (TPR) repeat protein